MVNGIFIDPRDVVVTLAAPVKAGDAVAYTDGGEKKTVVARQEIAVFHKMAVKPVKKGGRVVKYGELIGVASADILPGDHVHTHNVAEPERKEQP